MDFSTHIEKLLDIIGITRILRMATLFTVPLWIQYKFFPKPYANIKSTVSLNIVNIDSVISSINYTINILIFAHYIIVSTLFILGLCWLLHHIIRFILSLLDVYISSDNYFRNRLAKLCFTAYVHLGLYGASLAIYSDLLFKHNIPLHTISQTKVWYIPFFPFKFVLFTIIISLVIPPKRFR